MAVALWLHQDRWALFAVLRDKASSLTSMVGELSQPRGTIFDRNLKQLAVTLDRVSVYARTQEIRAVAETVKTLGEILSLDEKELQQKLEGNALRVWVAEEISLEQEIAVKSKRLPGIYLQKSEKRYYPNGSQAAHLLGYADNGIGLAGIEHTLDKIQASGKHLQEEADKRFSSEDLVLTLDIKIQELLDAILEPVVKDGGVEHGLACLMESGSGAVVAASQFPGFDPNTFAKFPQEVLANRLTMAMPLPQGFRTLLRDVALLYHHGNDEGWRLPWSVRALGSDLGSQLRLWERLRLSDPPLTDFTLVLPSGNHGGGEQRALLPQHPSLALVPERATPLNILAATATRLNGGKAVWPHVTTIGLDPRGGATAGKVAGDGQPAVHLPPLPEEAIHLFQGFSHGSAAGAFFFGDEVAVVRGSGQTARTHLVELLLVTIPAGGNDLLLLVVVERTPPGNQGKNGTKTMALAQAVAEKIGRISILQAVAKTVADVVEPETGEDVNYQDSDGDGAAPRQDGQLPARERSRITVMPDLHGQSLRQSLRLLQGVRLHLGIRGTGKVVSQKPAPGTSLQGVSEVVLTLEKPEEITPEVLAKRAAAGK